MNKIHIISAIAFLCLFNIGCKKGFLDTTPKDRLDANVFFNTAKDLEVYTNGFYEMLPSTTVYDASYGESSDDIVPLIVPERIRGNRLVPVGRGLGGWKWTDLRSINYFLENYTKCEDPVARAKYSGIARFFRANFYYDKVKMFGDVPWYNRPLKAGDEDLYKARDSRKLVMDSVLADINYAIENIPVEIQLSRITRYTALVLKARICLFEGTFRKYHNLGDHDKFLNEAVAASEVLISSGAYSLHVAGGANVAYRDLFARNNQTTGETILARDYNPDFERHGLGNLMTSPTMGSWGIAKDLINSYLLKDGNRFTDIPGYQTKGFYDEMQNRDPRLTQTTAGPDFTAFGETTREPVNLNATTTGYRVIKALATRDQWSTAFNDIILFRYAEALLIFAEAKAELGTITQTDLDKSINKLRDRVNMPHLNMITANASPDPFLMSMYPNVNNGALKGLILEIRRERRIELVNEGFRWDDLIRWKEGSKVQQPMVGIYFSGLGAFDFNNDGKADVYVHNGNTSGAPVGITSFININQRPLTNGTSGNLKPLSITLKFDESKDYYYPIPSEDITLNPNIIQNPFWK